jgi:hypothetical protein
MEETKKANILQTETDLIADFNKNIPANNKFINKKYLLGKNIF